MKNFRRRRLRGDESSLASQLMGLSLFIMLLAFFIVLNAVSDQKQEKSRSVLNSLSQTFGVTFDGGDMSPSSVQDTQESIREGDALDDMEALFRSQITGLEARQDKTLGLMHLRVPLDRFAGAVLAVGQGTLAADGGGGGFFLPTLVSLMKSAESGHTWRMDIVVNIAENPAHLRNEKPQELAKIMARAAGFARQLELAGLPPPLVSIGLGQAREQADTKFVDLYFRRHEPFMPVTSTDGDAP